MRNLRSNLSNLKSKVDKLDTGKLDINPVDLSKLSNVVKNNVVKKTKHDELVKNVNTIQTTDTSNLVQKKMTMTQSLVRFKKELLIMIVNVRKLYFKISTSKLSKQK